MKSFHIKFILLATIIFYSCTDIDDELYVAISPVTVDLTNVPLDKLSDYHFFDGNLKDQKPTLNVLPYKTASTSFMNYAQSKRFIWMPNNAVATYNGDDTVFSFPNGSALLQTIYYDNVAPDNTTKIIETRLLLKKTDGWQAFVYLWNTDQTEAFLDTTNNGAIIPITWTTSGISQSVNYKVATQSECIMCHGQNATNTGIITIPIGVKPQNLNNSYSYSTGIQNQLEKWKQQGYLGNDIPSSINSAVNWTDANQSLELRAKSYIDINCAHCHRDGGSSENLPVRFNFSNNDSQSFGICLTPMLAIPNNPYIITSQDPNHSVMTYRMNSTISSEMMPPIGREIVHQEGKLIIRNWINSMTTSCN